MRQHSILVLMTVSLILTTCAGRDMPARVVAPPPPRAMEPYEATGTASWYGKELHGKKTANGEVFDWQGISAAHRTLPLGTIVRVTNLDNSKSIKVRINDRGPFIPNRILDLSYGAAKELDFVSHGTARVRIESLKPVDALRYTVQAAAYTEEVNAKTLRYRLSRKFQHVDIVKVETNIAGFYCVRVGSYETQERAEQTAGKLKLEGMEPIILRKD
jgi:rare lipoprotein A